MGTLLLFPTLASIWAGRPAGIIAFMRRQLAELPIWSGIVFNLWKDCQHSKLPVSELEMWRRPAKCSLHIFSLGHSSQMGDLHPTNLLDQPDKINTRTPKSNQTHICYWRNMMINICKRKSFSWSFEIIKNNGLKVVLLCTAVNISIDVLFLGCRVGFLGCFSSSPFSTFSTQLHIFAAEGETNEQSFQYWSRLNSYCSCRNAI